MNNLSICYIVFLVSEYFVDFLTEDVADAVACIEVGYGWFGFGQGSHFVFTSFKL
ncbi:hypothetical protein PNA2_1466 [Pyrococcus sp. NA2]|nr:hypothetical protein PNA2_1466 [Pyrococcus sp. NA2]